MRLRGRTPTLALVVAALLAALLMMGATSSADTAPRSALPAAPAAPDAPAPVLINYQGRLLDPITGQPKPDNPYTMGFYIYNVAAGGTSLWDEKRDVTVSKGLFSVLLGEVTPLDPAIFNGQALWLSVNVESDNEATPRIPIAYVPYSLYAANSAKLGGSLPSAFATSGHSHDATYVNVTGDTMSGALSVGPTAGNTIYGLSSDAGAGYAGVVGTSTGGGTGVRGSSNNNYGGVFYSSTKPGLLADTKAAGVADLVLGGSDGDGQLTVEPASGANLTLSSENDVKVQLDKDNNGTGVFRVQNSAGSAVVTADEAGVVSAARVGYTAARTHYASVPGEAFSPYVDVAFSNSGGCGGAYVAVAGCYALVAAVQLPDGATINQFTAYFNDVSANDMTVSLQRNIFTGCGVSILASVNSAGTAGYYSVPAALSAVVDNTTGGYYVRAYSCNWDSSNLMIKGAVIRYTISEAP
jgi:hypothetical protein